MRLDMVVSQHAKYTVIRKIADGGMAEIFLALQRGAQGFERPVVLKRILTAFQADPQFRNMLLDEAHVAMGLHHNAIVQILDVGEAEGRTFLVLELVDGWDMNQVLHRARAAGLPFAEELALLVTAEVCRALHYAHGQMRDGKPLGIVHRDVSPHNVLVSEQGEVKLTDFGIAKARGKSERTGTGVIKGKLAFMSPEQASGAPLDRRSDLFSVGTMLYVMLTGRKPFDAPTDLESMLRIQRAEFAPPESVVPGMHAELAAIVNKAMRLRPSERYQTAEDMLVDVERVQRSVLRPAGQTELKRWLAELARADGDLPLSRRAPPPSSSALEAAPEPVAFSDVVVGETIALATPPPVTVPPTDDAPATRVDRPSTGGAGKSAGVATTTSSSWRGARLGVAAVLLLLAAAAAVLYLRPVEKRRDDVRRRSVSVPAASAPTPARPPEPASVVDGAAAADASSLEAAGAASVRDGAAADQGQAAEPDEVDVDEEALLRRKESDAETRVIGETDEASAAASTPAASRRSVASVSVKMVSRPVGAVVAVEEEGGRRKRVLGRAPLSLRFRPGITYAIEFQKTGYVTQRRSVAVTKKANQRVDVVLKKRPAPKAGKKSLLDRIFRSGEKGLR